MAEKRWRLCAMSISSYGMTLYVRRARSLRFGVCFGNGFPASQLPGRLSPCAKCNQCKAESQRKPATMNGQRSWQTNVPDQGARDLRQTNNWYGPDGGYVTTNLGSCTRRNQFIENIQNFVLILNGINGIDPSLNLYFFFLRVLGINSLQLFFCMPY